MIFRFKKKNDLDIFFDFFKINFKVTKIATEHQKWPKIGKNSKISSCFAHRAKKSSAKGQSPVQELEVGPRNGP